LIPGKAVTVVEPWLELALSYNHGTAFSIIRDLGAARVAFGVLALVVVIVLAVMIVRGNADGPQSVALGAIAGGAIGNGVDRAFGGGVVDFIKVNYPWGAASWPTFNVADALVVCGVAGLLLLRIYRRILSPRPVRA
jgi:signal peptidase II